MKTIKILMILLTFYLISFSQVQLTEVISQPGLEVDPNKSYNLSIDVSTFVSDTSLWEMSGKEFLGQCSGMCVHIEYFNLDDTTATITIFGSNKKGIPGGIVHESFPYIMNKNDSIIDKGFYAETIGYSSSQVFVFYKVYYKYLNFYIDKNTVTSGKFWIYVTAYK